MPEAMLPTSLLVAQNCQNLYSSGHPVLHPGEQENRGTRRSVRIITLDGVLTGFRPPNLALIRVCFQPPSIGLPRHRVRRADLCAEMLSTCSRDIARVINTGIARALFLKSQSAVRLIKLRIIILAMF